MTTVKLRLSARQKQFVIPEDDIAQCDPVTLYNQIDPDIGLTRADFASYLAVDLTTVNRWFCKMQKPSSQVQRLAAELKEKWEHRGWLRQ